MKTRLVQNILSAFILSMASSQIFAGYTITKIADTTSPDFSDFPDSDASINNSGTVVFKGEDALGNQSLYLSDDIATPIIANQTFESAPVISDSGTVVVGLYDSVADTTGLYDVTASSYIIDSSSSGYEEFANASINNSNVISFVATLNGGAEFAINKTPPLTTIDDTTGSLGQFKLTDINDSGVVSYVADPDVGTTSSLYTSASVTAIFSADDILSAVINDSSTVAYTDSTAVYSNTGGTLLSSGGTFSSFNRLAINNNDAIAVLGAVSGDSAIYARSSSGVLEKVIDTANDGVIDGKILLGVSMSQHAINDAGQIVFWATSVITSPLTVVEGIYLATPDFLLGDINSDGVINLADNLLLVQFVLGSKVPTAAESNAADMKQDAVLNGADLLLHSQTILGLI